MSIQGGFQCLPSHDAEGRQLSPGFLRRSKRIKTGLVDSFAIIIHHRLVPTTFADRTVGRFGNSIPGKFCRLRVVLRQLPLFLLLRGNSSLLQRRLGSNLSETATACSINFNMLQSLRSFGWFSTCSRGGSAESSFRISPNMFGCDLGISGEDV